MPDLVLSASTILAESAPDNPWPDLFRFIAILILFGFLAWLFRR
ncbi:hypothetical protein [Nocardia wallacei]|nr:hypothetical protein [Nocardia wallacei]